MNPITIKKIKMLGDVSKFSWAQAFSDKTGKTSITSILSAVTVVGSMLLMLITGIAAMFSVANAPVICSYALASLSLGAAMAGVNKVMGAKNILEETVVVSPDKTPVPISETTEDPTV